MNDPDYLTAFAKLVFLFVFPFWVLSVVKDGDNDHGLF
jgi:hypothetical protein